MAIAAGALGGCTGMDVAGFAPEPTYAYSGEAAVTLPDTITLPDTVSLIPSSYAGPSPSEGSFATAMLPPADLTVKEAEPEAEAAVVPRTEHRPLSQEAKSDVDRLISKYAALYEVPEALVRRVVKRESNFFPGAYSKGHWGLMQIKHGTARGMGYDGPAKGLLDAETNLKYAVKYLRGAWLVSRGSEDRAVGFYSRGYYYDAKRMGLLEETGLGRDRKRKRG